MSALVLLDLYTNWGKEIKREACRAFIFFRNKFNKCNNTWFTNVGFHLSYDPKNYFEIAFCLKTLRF